MAERRRRQDDDEENTGGREKEGDERQKSDGFRDTLYGDGKGTRRKGKGDETNEE